MQSKAAQRQIQRRNGTLIRHCNTESSTGRNGPVSEREAASYGFDSGSEEACWNAGVYLCSFRTPPPPTAYLLFFFNNYSLLPSAQLPLRFAIFLSGQRDRQVVCSHFCK